MCYGNKNIQPYKVLAFYVLHVLYCFHTGNVNFSAGGPVSYEVLLPFESTTVSYADFLYNGSEDSGMLRRGVGQLVDGVKGTELLDTDERRFPWVGWDTPLVEIIFDFGSPQQFDSVTVHAYFDNAEVTWFNTMEVAISQDKGQWNTFSPEINGLRGPQDVMALTQMEDGSNAEGRYVRLGFNNFQGSGPMLISEVSFDSMPGEFLDLYDSVYVPLTVCFCAQPDLLC